MLTVVVLVALAGHVVTGANTECIYDRTVHHLGDVWTTVEGCNTCRCTPNGMICSFQDCEKQRFAKPNAGVADCNSEGDWYKHRDFWLIKDGCNTCYCLMPGNFRGYQVCTATDCSLVNHHIG
ncbi:hypothetical protein SNE40_018047 [Patella caerulea]|uniref:Uncharacterized protein n=1 Tax=Patella caerulea TaxID=87958 RepID=A0AAN8PHE2_PATCE